MAMVARNLKGITIAANLCAVLHLGVNIYLAQKQRTAHLGMPIPSCASEQIHPVCGTHMCVCFERKQGMQNCHMATKNSTEDTGKEVMV
mmetsp:Transcript_62247/g.110643  ORF Transcript_62247/g.110643 Transcript_62247/m.110643 type:complete len:89 (+) Transcript_62247:159-425(+)